MDPIETLRNEHGLIRRFVDLLSMAVARLEVENPPPRAFFDDGIEFVRGFSDGFHHKKEENVMFRQLAQKKNGAIDGQIEALRYQHDQGRGFIADLEGMRERFGFSWEGTEPADHILALVGLMAHIVTLQAVAVRDDRIGEALYLEGIAEWLRRGHLAWFAEQIAGALNATQVCYLSHVAHALEQRVLPAGERGKPARRPSESIRDHELKNS